MILSVKDRQEEFYTITPMVVRNYNKSCRKILEYPPIAARILKDTISELHYEKTKEIEKRIINFKHKNKIKFNSNINEEDYDVLILYDGDKPIYINIQIVKNNHNNLLLKESIYLVSNLITYQKWDEFFYEDYENMKKVIQISIVQNRKGKNEIILKETIQNDHGLTKESYIDIIQINLSKQNKHNDCLKMLELIFLNDEEWEKRKKILKEELDIVFDEDIEGEIIKMNKWGEEIAEMNFEKGLLAGEENTLILCIKNIMETMKITLDEAMELLKVDENKKKHFRIRINKS